MLAGISQLRLELNTNHLYSRYGFAEFDLGWLTPSGKTTIRQHPAALYIKDTIDVIKHPRPHLTITYFRSDLTSLFALADLYFSLFEDGLLR